MEIYKSSLGFYVSFYFALTYFFDKIIPPLKINEKGVVKVAPLVLNKLQEVGNFLD